MSFYTSAVATRVFNPTFNSSTYRSTFKITEGGVYLTNLRLLNVGALTNQDGLDSHMRYNIAGGITSLIKNMYLYDGKQVLDSVQACADDLAFRMVFNKSNTANCDTSKYLLKHGLGYVYSNDICGNVLVSEFQEHTNHYLNQSELTSDVGFLDLRQVFPLLKAMNYLSLGPDGVFKNFELVVEWETTAVSYFTENNGKITATTQPILVMDRIDNPKLEAQVHSNKQPVLWFGRELDQVVMPVCPASGTFQQQQNKWRLSGFTGKTIKNLLLQKKGDPANSTFYKTHGSQVLYDQIDQVYVNGAQLLPGRGIDDDAMRLAILNDTYGVCNTCVSAATLPIFNVSDHVANPDQRCGTQSYTAIPLGGVKCTSLDLEMSRTFADSISALYKQRLQVLVFADVLKSLVYTKDGGYMISYV